MSTFQSGFGYNNQQKDDILDIKPDDDNFLKNKPFEIQLKNEIKRLKSEVKLLNDINFRLGKELSQAQIKMGIPKQVTILGDPKQNQNLQNEKLSNHIVQFFLTELSFLGPLITAYDDKIDTMDKMMKGVYDDLQEMEKKSQLLVEDNETLRDELEKKCQQILKMYKSGHAEENIVSVFSKLEKDDMLEKIKFLTEENNELLNNYTIAKERFEKSVKELAIISADLDQTREKFTENQTRLHQSEENQEELKHEKELLQKKYLQQSENLSILESEYSEMESKKIRNENEIKLLKSQVISLKKQLNDIQEKKQQEIEILLRDIESLKLRERENVNKLILVERDLDQFRDENRKMKKENEQSKCDMEQMIRMLENYEVKIQSFQKKEENMIALTKDHKEKVEEALLQRDKALLKEEQYKKQIESLSFKNKEEISQVRLQYDQMLENVKSKSETILSQREEEIEMINQDLRNANLQIQKLEKDNKSLKQEVTTLSTYVQQGHHFQIDEEISENQKKVYELEESLKIAESNQNEKFLKLQHEKNLMESQIKKQSEHIKELQSVGDSFRIQNQNVCQEITLIKTKYQSSIKDKQNLVDELNRLKKSFESKLEFCQQEYTQKVKDMQQQLTGQLSKEKIQKDKAIELLKNFDMAEQKLKNEYEARIKELENYVVQLKNQNKILHTQNVKLKDLDYPTQDQKTLQKLKA